MFQFQVEGMTCGGCVRSLTRSVQAIDGNAKVDVDLAAKRVRVDTSAELAAVTAAIVDAGYPVTASANV